MLELKAYLNTADGVRHEYMANTSVAEKDGVFAVYMKGVAQKPLAPDFGAGIDIAVPQVTEYMADVRHMEWWCGPFFGKSFADMPDETQGLVCKTADGAFCVMLPVVSDKYKCVLKGGKSGCVTARIFSRYDKLTYCDTLALVYAVGDNPFTLLEKCAHRATELLNNGCRTREKRRYPEIFEYLGWCSWDALQIRVNEEDLLKKCDEFKQKNIPVKWALIDDMWGDVRDFWGAEYKNREEMSYLMHAAKLYSFKADPKRFPNGLKACIDKINERGLKVGMWHPTTGYWMGIDPAGEIFRDLGDCLIQASDGSYVHSYEQDKAYKYYNAIHDYLSESGAEFVKIDNQSMSRKYYENRAPIGTAARSYHKAMEASVGAHFDNAMINCMGMASEDMFNRSVSPISRCSADFQPEDREWFIYHIMQCSYNDLFQGQFYWCDWDMWWTDDGQAVKNSVLRAISGGPVYVSDMLERSNADILKPLALKSGKILRCDRPAMPAADCLVTDPRTSGKIFKLQNTCNDCGIMAVFNLDGENKSVCGSICVGDVQALHGEEFAVYEHFSREMFILRRGECKEITLADNDDFRLYSIVPLKNGFAAIGRTDKFISPATVKCVRERTVELVENGEYAYVENGKLVIKNNTTEENV